jgi:hypothetical protein
MVHRDNIEIRKFLACQISQVTSVRSQDVELIYTNVNIQFRESLVKRESYKVKVQLVREEIHVSKHG